MGAVILFLNARPPKGDVNVVLYKPHQLWLFSHHLTGAKRRECMGCWGLLGLLLFIVIVDHSLIPYV